MSLAIQPSEFPSSVSTVLSGDVRWADTDGPPLTPLSSMSTSISVRETGPGV